VKNKGQGKGSGHFDPLILNLRTRLGQVVSFTSWLIYPRVKSPWYSSDRRLGGLQGLSGHFREEKNILPLLGIKPCFLHHTAHCLVTIQTMLYQLLQFYMCKTKIMILLSWTLICLP